MSLSLTDAKAILSRIEERAHNKGLQVCAAVVDAGGNPIATIRMDRAQIGAYALAMDKAWTAVAFQSPTEQWAADTVPGKPAWGFSTVLGGRVVVFGGGLPLIRDDAIVGGVGVSGSSAENDADCARAALVDADFATKGSSDE